MKRLDEVILSEQIQFVQRRVQMQLFYAACAHVTQELVGKSAEKLCHQNIRGLCIFDGRDGVEIGKVDRENAVWIWNPPRCEHVGLPMVDITARIAL